MIKPFKEQVHPIDENGIHKLYKFDNDFGASVVRCLFSYGGDKGLYELAVIRWEDGKWNMVSDTEITDDVIGWLSEEEVEDLLKRIMEL